MQRSTGPRGVPSRTYHQSPASPVGLTGSGGGRWGIGVGGVAGSGVGADWEAVGMKLVAALKNAKALPSITVDALKSVLAKFPASVQSPGAELLAHNSFELA